MLRNIFLLSAISSAIFCYHARAEKRFFIAPDRFEIENVGGTPSVRFSKNRFGTVASFILVPGYDVALSAIGYAHRDSRSEVEIIRLPADVQDFVLTSRLAKTSSAVRGVEKERDRNRVIVRILFSTDVTPEQTQEFLSGYKVYGTIQATIPHAEGVPTTLRGKILEGLPAFNQFQETTDGEAKLARGKYDSLTQYKAQQTVALAKTLAKGADLDSSVRDSLMIGESRNRINCRNTLKRYENWICLLILESSSDGSLSEAIFELAKKVFPAKLVNEESTVFVFDPYGRPVKWKSVGVLTTELQPGQSELERILATRTHPSMDETQYRAQLYRYALNLFYVDTRRRDVEKIVDVLMSIHSLEVDSEITRAFMGVVFLSTELGRTSQERVASTLTTMHRGIGPRPVIEQIMAKRERLTEPAYEAELQKYFERYFRHFTAEQRLESAKVMLTYRSVASNPGYNRTSLSRLFLEAETAVAGSSSEDAPKSEIDKILGSARQTGMTSAEITRRLEAYVALHYPETNVEGRAKIAKYLRKLYDNDDPFLLDAERRMFKDVLRLVEEIEKEENP